MLIYLINLFIVAIAAILAMKSKSKTASRFYLSIIFVSMVLVAGLRDSRIGTDTGSYVGMFNAIWSFLDSIALGSSTWEYGFWILNWLVHLVSDQYMFLLLAIAMITIGCYQWAIVKYSAHLVISFLVFIMMGFYTFFFNGARQGMACAICALAIGPLQERNFFKYAMYIVIAFFFHKSAIIALPVYFIFNKINTIKKNIFIILVGCAGALYLQSIVDLSSTFFSRYNVYGVAGEGGGYYTAGFICLLSLFFLYLKKFIEVDRERYDLFLNMLLFGAVVSIVPSFFSLNPSGILRLNLYFSISVVFLWPILYINIKNNLVKIYFSCLFTGLYLIYFMLTTQKFSNLTPYMFNSTLRFF
jgi:hypothetical protein